MLSKIDRTDAQKAALVTSGARRSQEDWWVIFDSTTPEDVLTLNALSSFTTGKGATPTPVFVAKEWRSSWKLHAAERARDEVFINRSLRSLWKSGRLSYDGARLAMESGERNGAILAYLHATTDKHLISEIILDETTIPEFREVLFSNPDTPQNPVDTFVNRSLDTAWREFEETGEARNAAFSDVMTAANAVPLTPSTVARITDTCETFYASVRPAVCGEPGWIGRLPGVDIQPYSPEVQDTLMASRRWYRMNLLLRNPHVTGSVVTAIMVHILSEKLPQGGHKRMLETLSAAVANPNLDGVSASAAIAKDKRKKVRNAIASTLTSRIYEDLGYLRTFERDGADRSSIMKRIAHRYVLFNDASVKGGDDTRHRIVTALVTAAVTQDDIDSLSVSDDELSRVFASRILVETALS